MCVSYNGSLLYQGLHRGYPGHGQCHAGGWGQEAGALSLLVHGGGQQGPGHVPHQVSVRLRCNLLLNKTMYRWFLLPMIGPVLNNMRETEIWLENEVNEEAVYFI